MPEFIKIQLMELIPYSAVAQKRENKGFIFKNLNLKAIVAFSPP
jgi:hypothetical protein